MTPISRLASTFATQRKPYKFLASLLVLDVMYPGATPYLQGLTKFSFHTGPIALCANSLLPNAAQCVESCGSNSMSADVSTPINSTTPQRSTFKSKPDQYQIQQVNHMHTTS
jgi:hypothetical protein